MIQAINKIVNSLRLLMFILFQLQSYLYILAALIISLYNPMFHASSWLINIKFLMILQLVFIEANIFLGFFGQIKLRGVWLYFLFVFSIFVLAISDDFYILLAFVLQSISLYFRPASEAEFRQSFIRGALHACCFFLSAAIIFIPKFPWPQFNLTPEVLEQLITNYGAERNTLHLMYWGLLYFTLTGLFELRLMFYRGKETNDAKPPTVKKTIESRPTVKADFGAQLFLLLCWLLPAVPVALITVYLTINTITFLPHTKVTTGEIIDFKAHYPIITFKTEAGQAVTFESDSSSAHDRIGKKVSIRYKAQQPRQARVNSFFSLWGMEAVCLILGIPLWALCYYAIKEMFFERQSP